MSVNCHKITTHCCISYIYFFIDVWFSTDTLSHFWSPTMRQISTKFYWFLQVLIADASLMSFRSFFSCFLYNLLRCWFHWSFLYKGSEAPFKFLENLRLQDYFLPIMKTLEFINGNKFLVEIKNNCFILNNVLIGQKKLQDR